VSADFLALPAHSFGIFGRLTLKSWLDSAHSAERREPPKQIGRRISTR